MASAQINGIELFYEDSDPTNESGKPVVFWNHGAGGNHMSWWQQIPVFRQDYRCIAIDHRGFGRSLDTTGEGVARFMAEDYERIRAAQKVRADREAAEEAKAEAARVAAAAEDAPPAASAPAEEG